MGNTHEHKLDKNEVKFYFDTVASTWDADLIKDEEKVRIILNYADIDTGMRVLDVACGTGVLFPNYIHREVASVTGVDISPKMVAIAKEKFPQENIEVICSDVEALDNIEAFDRCVIYNAFPHFPNPASVIAKMSELTKPGGRLTVAHGMSKAKIDKRHEGSASGVSIGLLDTDDMEKLFAPYFDVDVKVSDEHMYVVSGVKR